MHKNMFNCEFCGVKRMGRHNSRLFDSFSNGYYNGDYTEEEQRGVDKYLWRRFVGGMSVMCVMILLVLTGYVCSCVSHACTRAELGGTWILADDYSDGYDADDRVVEFRYQEIFREDKELVLYMNGSKRGRVILREGRHAVEFEYRYFPLSPSWKVTIWITEENGQVTLDYKDHVKSEGEWVEKDVTETYIRVSEECSLTEDRLAELY